MKYLIWTTRILFCGALLFCVYMGYLALNKKDARNEFEKAGFIRVTDNPPYRTAKQMGFDKMTVEDLAFEVDRLKNENAELKKAAQETQNLIGLLYLLSRANEAESKQRDQALASMWDTETELPVK